MGTSRPGLIQGLIQRVRNFQYKKRRAALDKQIGRKRIEEGYSDSESDSKKSPKKHVLGAELAARQADVDSSDSEDEIFVSDSEDDVLVSESSAIAPPQSIIFPEQVQPSPGPTEASQGVAKQPHSDGDDLPYNYRPTTVPVRHELSNASVPLSDVSALKKQGLLATAVAVPLPAAALEQSTTPSVSFVIKRDHAVQKGVLNTRQALRRDLEEILKKHAGLRDGETIRIRRDHSEHEKHFFFEAMAENAENTGNGASQGRFIAKVVQPRSSKTNGYMEVKIFLPRNFSEEAGFIAAFSGFIVDRRVQSSRITWEGITDIQKQLFLAALYSTVIKRDPGVVPTAMATVVPVPATMVVSTRVDDLSSLASPVDMDINGIEESEIIPVIPRENTALTALNLEALENSKPGPDATLPEDDTISSTSSLDSAEEMQLDENYNVIPLVPKAILVDHKLDDDLFLGSALHESPSDTIAEEHKKKLSAASLGANGVSVSRGILKSQSSTTPGKKVVSWGVREDISSETNKPVLITPLEKGPAVAAPENVFNPEEMITHLPDDSDDENLPFSRKIIITANKSSHSPPIKPPQDAGGKKSRDYGSALVQKARESGSVLAKKLRDLRDYGSAVASKSFWISAKAKSLVEEDGGIELQERKPKGDSDNPDNPDNHRNETPSLSILMQQQPQNFADQLSNVTGAFEAEAMTSQPEILGVPVLSFSHSAVTDPSHLDNSDAMPAVFAKTAPEAFEHVLQASKTFSNIHRNLTVVRDGEQLHIKKKEIILAIVKQHPKTPLAPHDGLSVCSQDKNPEKKTCDAMLHAIYIAKKHDSDKQVFIDGCDHNPALALKFYMGCMLRGLKPVLPESTKQLISADCNETLKNIYLSFQKNEDACINAFETIKKCRRLLGEETAPLVARKTQEPESVSLLKAAQAARKLVLDQKDALEQEFKKAQKQIALQTKQSAAPENKKNPFRFRGV